MRKLLTDLKNSLWFMPAVMVIGAAGLALGAVELDSIVGEDALSRFPRLFGVRAEGARQLLASIAGSTITVTGVVFSITIVALSLTAAQYSPRVLRNFMSDRANQTVLGVFVGIYVYCLLVLRTVRGGDESFVPGISIAGALLLALIGIGFLIYFIHHVALSIQVSHIAARIHRDTLESIRAAYPTGLAEAAKGLAEPAGAYFVTAEQTGYLQQIDIDRLSKAASLANRVVRMEKGVGEFVIAGQPLAAVSGTTALEPEFSAAVRAACAISAYRDIGQDPAFGVQQLVDIALKALSPGVNDVGTARGVIHYLAALMCELAGRAIEEERQVLRDGRLTVVKRCSSFGEFLDSAFGAIRRDAVARPDMVIQLLSALGELSSATLAPARRACVLLHVEAIEQALSGEKLTDADATAVAQAIREAVAGRPSDAEDEVRAKRGAALTRVAAALFLAGALVPGPWTPPAAAADARPASSIEVTAESEVEVPPDLAVLEFGVRTEAETADAAARDNAKRMQAVLAALRSALGAGAQLQTGSYTLRPNYAPPRDGGPAQVTGYVAVNTVQLRTAELPRLGELIDLATRAGANQVQRVAYTLRDQSVPRREALRSAAQAARGKAETLAQSMGLKVTGFHSLVEQDVGDVRPLVRDAMLARAEVAVTPMEPGLIIVRARVVLTVLVAR